MAASTGQQFSGNVCEKNTECRQTSGDAELVPKQLKEVVSLMSSINRRLEDCAVEWQSAVSRNQWRILDSNPDVSQKSWEQSLLARTYFTDKSLDEAFQNLLLQDRTFTEQLNNFVGLLRGDKPLAMNAGGVRDAQNQCPDGQSIDCCHTQSKLPTIDPLNLSLLDDRVTRKTRKSKRLAGGNATITTVRQSFADLIKAKINLDTKFLGFEAVLNGDTAAPVEEPSCLCQICSNVLGTAANKGNMIKSIAAVKQKVERITRAKNKRLTKSSRTWTRSKSKNNQQTVSMVHIGDQAAIGSPRDYEHSAAE